MNKWILYSIIFVLIVFVVATITQPTIEFVSTENELPFSQDVNNILKNSCTDCHSYNTKVPWFGKVPPVSYIIAKHVRSARTKLNFHHWNEYTDEEQMYFLLYGLQMMENSEIPMNEYVWVNHSAKIDSIDYLIFKKYLENLYQVTLDENSTKQTMKGFHAKN